MTRSLVLSGSRNRQGQTARAVNAVCQGVAAAGGTTETVFLTELNLERCRQCEADGWGICRREGRCIIDDDFALLVEKIQSADVVVFANPVYFGDICESLRTFLERFRRTRFARFGRPPAPGMPPAPAIPGTPVVGYCYAGGSGNGTASCCASLERLLQTGGFDVVDMILARRQNLDFKLQLLEQVGRWLVSKPTSGPPYVPPGR